MLKQPGSIDVERDLLRRAGTELHRFNYQKAIDDYSRTIRLDPNEVEAFRKRGYAYNNIGLYKKAINDCNKTIKLDPTLALNFSNRGSVYNSIGLQQKAINDCTQAIKLDPKLPDAFFERGAAYNNDGQLAWFLVSTPGGVGWAACLDRKL